MVKKTHNISDRQNRELERLARKLGLTVSELFRRAIDLLLEKEAGK